MDKKKGAAKSLNGLSNDDLQVLLNAQINHRENDILEALTTIVNRIANGWLVWQSEGREQLVAVRGVIFVKDLKGGIRPIGIGHPLILLTTRILCVRTRVAAAEYCHTSQLGLHKGGVEIYIHSAHVPGS